MKSVLIVMPEMDKDVYESAKSKMLAKNVNGQMITFSHIENNGELEQLIIFLNMVMVGLGTKDSELYVYFTGRGMMDDPFMTACLSICKLYHIPAGIDVASIKDDLEEDENE